MTKVLLLGANFLAGLVFTRLCGFNDIHITVMANKDPLAIMNTSNDVHKQIKRYCKGFSYKDVYTGREFGDPKRNMKISFMFRDYINENITNMISDVDIIINCGAIYDSLYAQANQKETLNVNVNGIHNVIRSLSNITRNGDKNPLFIQMSSINVYGVQKEGNDEITEDDTMPNPQDLLNISLLAQENMVKGFLPHMDVDYIILRLGNLTGDFTPIHSLTNSAVTALLNQEPEYTLDNFKNSIEVLDSVDFGSLITNIIQQYKDGDIEKIKNQIYNIKSDEGEPKTIETIVQSIFSTASYLPVITEEHYKQMGLTDYKGPVRIKAPKLRYGMESYKIDFGGRTISNNKAVELLKHRSMNPLIQSLLPKTANYLMNYILGDLTETQRVIYAKMLWLPSVPKPSVMSEEVNEDVRKLAEEVNENIDKSLS